MSICVRCYFRTNHIGMHYVVAILLSLLLHAVRVGQIRHFQSSEMES